MFYFWCSRGHLNTHFIRSYKEVGKWIWGLKNSWVGSSQGPGNLGMDMVSLARIQIQPRMSQEWTPSCTSTFTFIYFVLLLPNPPPQPHLRVILETKLEEEKVSVPIGPGYCMLQRKQRGVLGHRLKLHGARPLPETCVREKAKGCQVPGARAEHKELCPKKPRQRRKGEEIQATNSKVQGCKALFKRSSYIAQHMGQWALIFPFLLF